MLTRNHKAGPQTGLRRKDNWVTGAPPMRNGRPQSGSAGVKNSAHPISILGTKKNENETAEATAMEIVGPAAFALNKFGTLTFVG